LTQRIRSHGVALTALDFAGGLLIVLLFSAAVVSAVVGVLALSRALHEPLVPPKSDETA
jgi:hypothetical protein